MEQIVEFEEEKKGGENHLQPDFERRENGFKKIKKCR